LEDEGEGKIETSFLEGRGERRVRIETFSLLVHLSRRRERGKERKETKKRGKRRKQRKERKRKLEKKHR
jgi:hypothetical protein